MSDNATELRLRITASAEVTPAPKAEIKEKA